MSTSWGYEPNGLLDVFKVAIVLVTLIVASAFHATGIVPTGFVVYVDGNGRGTLDSSSFDEDVVDHGPVRESEEALWEVQVARKSPDGVEKALPKEETCNGTAKRGLLSPQSSLS
ncbi:hypothetical protein BDV10DRAFT_184874 [Aspergillus recurvatus]